jgi:hypothetical protein
MRTGERDIYGQRIGTSGDTLWPAGGISLCGNAAPQGEPVAIAVDDGWIVAWVDYRNNDESDCRSSAEDSCGDIYAQKVTLNGQRVWTDNNFTGVAVDVYPARVQYESLHIVPDADGGAYIAWPPHFTSMVTMRASSKRAVPVLHR